MTDNTEPPSTPLSAHFRRDCSRRYSELCSVIFFRASDFANSVCGSNPGSGTEYCDMAPESRNSEVRIDIQH
jgi:hypothetical protein